MRKLLTVSAALAAFALTGPAVDAGTATSTLTIQATLTTSCAFANPTYTADVSTLAAAAGPGNLPGTVALTCTTGLPFSVAASAGNVGSCAATTNPTGRYMASGANKIGYTLFLGTLSAPLGTWCDGTGTTLKYSSTGTGTSQSVAYLVGLSGYSSDAYNPGHTPYPAGTYTDSITLTASF